MLDMVVYVQLMLIYYSEKNLLSIIDHDNGGGDISGGVDGGCYILWCW
jgi:hypothetical protein